MISVRIVITQDPAIVASKYRMIDIGDVVSGYNRLVFLLISPSFILQNTATRFCRKLKSFPFKQANHFAFRHGCAFCLFLWPFVFSCFLILFLSSLHLFCGYCYFFTSPFYSCALCAILRLISVPINPFAVACPSADSPSRPNPFKTVIPIIFRSRPKLQRSTYPHPTQTSLPHSTHSTHSPLTATYRFQV